MSFDDIKQFNGQRYTGLSVGGRHHWNYHNAVWEEQKVAPDRWHIKFSAIKSRHTPAPIGSGVPLKTSYLWHISADQVVTKVSKDEYLTLMQGIKTKIAHKRPYWKAFSCCYEGQQTYRQRRIAFLKNELEKLEGEEASFGQDVGDKALASLLSISPAGAPGGKHGSAHQEKEEI